MARSQQMIRTMQQEEGMTHFTDLDVSTFLLSWGFMSKFGLFSCLLKLTFKSLLIFRFCRRHGWWKLRYLSAFLLQHYSIHEIPGFLCLVFLDRGTKSISTNTSYQNKLSIVFGVRNVEESGIIKSTKMKKLLAFEIFH